MKRVCIVTICNGSNFGNRLQNYALQEAIKKVTDNEVVTVRNNAGELIRTNGVVYKILRNNYIEKILLMIVKHPKIRKKIKFNQFNKKYICWSKEVINGENVPGDFVNKYDYFVAGSDQVWNVEIPFISSSEFLRFAPSDKKIAYAASFGMSNFPDDKLKVIEEWLRGFEYISVREDSALEILKKVGITDAKVLVDPTLLLSAGQWEELEEIPEFDVEVNEYILVYVLEGDKTSILKDVHETAMKTGWKIIDIYDRGNSRYYGISPAEFIYLFHHAAEIYTNSFHAVVFSILFHKNAHVYKREGLNTRINTLLHMLGIEEYIERKQMEKIDWEQVDFAIDVKKKEAFEFIEQQIK